MKTGLSASSRTLKRTAAPEPSLTRLQRLRGLLPTLALVGIAATAFGMIAADRRSSSAADEAAKPAKVTVRRELPPDMAEDQVPKWVPIRQPSGRVELAPWLSVDAETARDPEAIEKIMAVEEPESEAAGDGATDSQPDSPVASQSAGSLAEVRARVLGVETGTEAPGDPDQVAEHVEGRGAQP